jgi:hypothetical protein
MKLDADLTAVSRLAFDTAPIIYFVEAHPRYDALVTAIFERLVRRSPLFPRERRPGQGRVAAPAGRAPLTRPSTLGASSSAG